MPQAAALRDLPRAAPEEAGFEPAALDEAVRFAVARETAWPRDLKAHLEGGYFEPPPFNEILGPIRPRGGPNGLISRHGVIAASWGNTRQVDFTFSVAKLSGPSSWHRPYGRADPGPGRTRAPQRA